MFQDAGASVAQADGRADKREGILSAAPSRWIMDRVSEAQSVGRAVEMLSSGLADFHDSVTAIV